MNKFDLGIHKEALKTGLKPGFVATLCCLGPLILIMMGLISASTALSITTYRKWFLILSVILFIGTVWFYLKKRRQIICGGCETKNQERQKIITFVAISAAVAFIIFALLFYVVLPWLAPIVFENFYIKKTL